MIASVLLIASLATAQAAQPPDRIARVARWLALIQQHQIGKLDEGAEEIGSWSDADLSQLWFDLRSLRLLMRDPSRDVAYTPPGSRAPVRLSREPAARRRMVELACAAGGIATTDPECIKGRVIDRLDESLQTLAKRAARGEVVGADNYILKYGALLHTDIALFAPLRISPITATGGVQRLRVLTADGQPTGMGQSGVHWEIARMLLDGVRSSRKEGPAPHRDAFVRNWYVATNVWMQFNVHYDTPHLDRAGELFPNDRDILFLQGTQREIYATPRIQNVVKTVALPSGFTLDMKAHGDELRLARAFYRRALAVDGAFAEAHLHLGRVLALEHNFVEAERELSEALDAVEDEGNDYFAALFLGAVDEALGRFDAARQAFERAAAHFPLAQSPMLSLAELARRRGDRTGALERLQILFALPAAADSRKDPWWVYDLWHARDVDTLLDDLWRPFRGAVAQ